MKYCIDLETFFVSNSVVNVVGKLSTKENKKKNNVLMYKDNGGIIDHINMATLINRLVHYMELVEEEDCTITETSALSVINEVFSSTTFDVNIPNTAVGEYQYLDVMILPLLASLVRSVGEPPKKDFKSTYAKLLPLTKTDKNNASVFGMTYEEFDDIKFDSLRSSIANGRAFPITFMHTRNEEDPLLIDLLLKDEVVGLINGLSIATCPSHLSPSGENDTLVIFHINLLDGAISNHIDSLRIESCVETVLRLDPRLSSDNKVISFDSLFLAL